MEDENYKVDTSSNDDKIPLDVQESANAAGDGVPEKSRKLYEGLQEMENRKDLSK